MSEQEHNQETFSPVELNAHLTFQTNAYLEMLGRDPIQPGSQIISNAVLERQLAQLKAEYRASKP